MTPTALLTAVAAGTITPQDAEREAGWQPIATAPKDGTNILTYPHYCVTHWVENECYPAPGWAVAWEDVIDKYITNLIATHWMPLPIAPKEDAR